MISYNDLYLDASYTCEDGRVVYVKLLRHGIHAHVRFGVRSQERDGFGGFERDHSIRQSIDLASDDSYHFGTLAKTYLQEVWAIARLAGTDLTIEDDDAADREFDRYAAFVLACYPMCHM